MHIFARDDETLAISAKLSQYGARTTTDPEQALVHLITFSPSSAAPGIQYAAARRLPRYFISLPDEELAEEIRRMNVAQQVLAQIRERHEDDIVVHSIADVQALLNAIISLIAAFASCNGQYDGDELAARAAAAHETISSGIRSPEDILNIAVNDCAYTGDTLPTPAPTRPSAPAPQEAPAQPAPTIGPPALALLTELKSARRLAHRRPGFLAQIGAVGWTLAPWTPPPPEWPNSCSTSPPKTRTSSANS